MTCPLAPPFSTSFFDAFPLAFGPRGFSNARGSYDLAVVDEVLIDLASDPVPDWLGVDGDDGCA